MLRTVFIASSFDKDNPLYQVFFEANELNTIVNSLPEWKCQLIHKINLETVTQKFSNTTESCFQVFHFAGHAIDKALQFNFKEAQYESAYLANVGGFAKIIKAIHPVQLVFLNGCSTVKQVEAFKSVGVPAVIYTNMPLNDALGNLFAKVFYAAFFKENNTLEAAFKIANAALEERQTHFNDKGFDPKIKETMNRGIDIFEEKPDETLYELSASDEFKKQRWADWPKPDFAAPPRLPDPLDLQSKEIPDSVLHCCNRNDELDEYHELLEQLAAKKSDGPVFFFVHEKSPALPQSLVKRFELFGTTELCESNAAIDKNLFVWKEMNLPRRKDLRQPGIGKSRLYEIYDANLFKCPFDGQQYVFQESTHGDKVFIIHHNLTDLELESPDDIKLWLEYYMSEFSQKVNRELKARLAIIFSCLYFGERKDFEQLFEGLANDPRFQGRVKNLTAMQSVSLQNVGVWKEKVFKDRKVPAPPDEKELFPFAEGERKPMKEVQEILAQKLFDYNQKIRSQHA